MMAVESNESLFVAYFERGMDCGILTLFDLI